jgi:hypothetical protein
MMKKTPSKYLITTCHPGHVHFMNSYLTLWEYIRELFGNNTLKGDSRLDKGLPIKLTKYDKIKS